MSVQDTPKIMNTNNENANSETVDVEEVVIADNATQEEKDEAFAKLQETNKQLFARAKKAEGFEFKEGKWVKPSKPAETTKPFETTSQTSASENLSQADLMTIVRSNIPEEDVQEVVNYAKFKNIPVAEAMKSTVIKTMLADNLEQRKVSEGTSTGGQRRGTGKTSDEALLENAQKGIMPESTDDIARLIKLRNSQK